MNRASKACFALLASIVLSSSSPSLAEGAGGGNGHEKVGVRVANVNAFYSGGNTIGGCHPTAAAWSFTVPEGRNRLLLVVTTPEADPSLKGKKSTKGHNISQRAMLSSLTYAGKELKCLTKFDEATYDHRHIVFWYLLDPPVGTANFEAIQFHCNNGGELYGAAYALTGVNRDDPFDKPVRFLIKRDEVHTVKCRPGGMVVAEARAIKLMNPDPSQVVRYANDKSRIGTTAVGSPEVKLSWTWPGTFLQKGSGKYRAAPKGGGVVAIALHPQTEFKAAPEVAKEAYALEPLPPAKTNGKEQPGISVTLYDLSSNPAKGGRNKVNYKSAAYGYRIPGNFAKEKVLTRKTVPNVDFKYDFGHNAALKYDKGFADLGHRDNFVAEFKGMIALPESGRYVFELNSNDQAKLFIGGQLIIDNPGHNHFTMKMASLRLKQGKYGIRVVYMEEAWKKGSKRQSHGVRLGWRPPSGYPKDMPIQRWKLEKGVHPIPASAFTHEIGEQAK